MEPKTEEQLKQEWGLERFVKALGQVSGWLLNKKHPISMGELEELLELSKDAFDLFASRLYYQSFETD